MNKVEYKIKRYGNQIGYTILKDGHTMFPEDVIKELNQKPKEKPMKNKVIFENERGVRLAYRNDPFRKITEDEFVDYIKRLGLILKSPVDEAEETINKIEEKWVLNEYYNLSEEQFYKIKDGFNMLKSEIERLKK